MFNMKKLFNSLIVVVIAALCIGLDSCKKNDEPTPEVTPEELAANIPGTWKSTDDFSPEDNLPSYLQFQKGGKYTEVWIDKAGKGNPLYGKWKIDGSYIAISGIAGDEMLIVKSITSSKLVLYFPSFDLHYTKVNDSEIQPYL